MSSYIHVIYTSNCFSILEHLLVRTCRFREIAKSTTENQFEQNLDNLRSSKIWKNKLKLQQWFERIWLANYEVTTYNFFLQCITF